MKPLITITGDIGSGKSTIGRHLANGLGYGYVSGGEIQRRLASGQGLTTLEQNKLSMDDPAVDERIDGYLRQLDSTAQRMVVDSRLAWFFIRDAFNIYISVDPVVGARRVLSTPRDEEHHDGLADAVRNNMTRKQLEDERFACLYNANCKDIHSFNLVLDSTWVRADPLARLAAQAFADAQEDVFGSRALICPRSLYPTQQVRELAGDTTERVFRAMEAEGFDDRTPIGAVRFGDYFFIWDGHWRTSCALRMNLDLVPCEIHLAHEESPIRGLQYGEEVRASLGFPWLADWESAHSFDFALRPENDGKPNLGHVNECGDVRS